MTITKTMTAACLQIRAVIALCVQLAAAIPATYPVPLVSNPIASRQQTERLAISAIVAQIETSAEVITDEGDKSARQYNWHLADLRGLDAVLPYA